MELFVRLSRWIFRGNSSTETNARARERQRREERDQVAFLIKPFCQRGRATSDMEIFPLTRDSRNLDSRNALWIQNGATHASHEKLHVADGGGGAGKEKGQSERDREKEKEQEERAGVCRVRASHSCVTRLHACLPMTTTTRTWVCADLPTSERSSI